MDREDPSIRKAGCELSTKLPLPGGSTPWTPMLFKDQMYFKSLLNLCVSVLDLVFLGKVCFSVCYTRMYR